MKKEIKKPLNPIDMFFKLGNWITKGDASKQLDFTYYMLWILFLAFFTMFITNIWNFFHGWDVSNLIYAAIGFAIMSLQFFSLKNMYEGRKLMKEQKEIKIASSEEKEVIEDIDNMLSGFEITKKEVK